MNSSRKNSYYSNNFKEERVGLNLDKFININYIAWFRNFIKKYGQFIDKDLLKNNNLSDDDRKNLLNFSKFYQEISLYAKGNYYYPDENNMIYKYKIRDNKDVYEIGRVFSDGEIFYCKKLDNYTHDNIIDLYDVLENKKSPRVVFIKKDLDSLQESIISLYQKGVPKEAIKEMIFNTLLLLEKKEEVKKGKSR